MTDTASPDLIRYPRRRLIRGLLRGGIIAALSVLVDLKLEGRENIPASGPYVVVGNHFSFLDPVAVIRIFPQPLEFLGGFRTPNAPAWTEVFRTGWGVLKVRRGSSSRDSLLAAQAVLEQKGVLVVFPEGGSWATVLRPARPGAALLALRARAPILPVGLDGLLDVFSLKRPRATVRIGKVFHPQEVVDSRLPMREQLTQLGHVMMQRIAELIPPERRGHYSDDPAVREAARGTEIYPWENNPEY